MALNYLLINNNGYPLYLSYEISKDKPIGYGREERERVNVKENRDPLSGKTEPVILSLT